MITLSALLTRSAFLAAASSSSMLSSMILLNTEKTLEGSKTELDGSFGTNVTLNRRVYNDFPSEQECISDDKNRKVSSYCSSALFVRKQVAEVIAEDATLAGPLIRLAFHDAATIESSVEDNRKRAAKIKTTGGPNGSIRYELDDDARFENRGLRRPMKIVQQIHREAMTKRNVSGILGSSKISLADVIALAGAAATECVGGPHIPIRMGRPDVNQADPIMLRQPLEIPGNKRSRVERTLPSAGLDSDGVRLYFGRLGLTEEEFVALSGSHGLGRHVTLLGMSKSCLKQLTRSCLEDAPVLMPFVTAGVDKFNNAYFRALLRWNDREVEVGEVGFIPTDVTLVVDSGLRQHVTRFADDNEYFFQVYTSAYQKLVDSTATSQSRH